MSTPGDESGYLHPNRFELRNQYYVRLHEQEMSILTRTLLVIILAGARRTLALSASAPVRPSPEKSDSPEENQRTSLTFHSDL